MIIQNLIGIQKKKNYNEETSSSSLPTVCSSTSIESDVEQKSWCTNSSRASSKENEESQEKFTYKEILMMKDLSVQSSASSLVAPEIEIDNQNDNNNIIWKKFNNKALLSLNQNMENEGNQNIHDTLKSNNGQGNLFSNKIDRKHCTSKQNKSDLKDILKYTRNHTNGEKFARLGGSRIDTTIIRESICQAVSQGVISKSKKRELRQSLLRGDVASVLEGLRRHCHLRPIISAIDDRCPTDHELRNTNGMNKCLNNIEPLLQTDELTKKHIAFMELERIADQWIMEEGMKKQSNFESSDASIFSAGSYYLKVDSPHSDLNLVLLTPIWISNKDFFYNFKQKLCKRTEISNIMIKEDSAVVSGLQFRFYDVQVELLFARFSQNYVPKNLPIYSDHILSGLDPASVRSLSGTRAAALILDLVPNPSNFRITLGAIRAWANRRGIHSSRMGFLGGISWSILVALICQMLPKAAPATIFHHFFRVYSIWKWPTPVVLSKIYDAGLGFKQWNPKENVHDRSHIMPIITPGYPAVNCSSSVNFSTFCIIHEEFMRALILLDNMNMRTMTNPKAWSSVFSKTDFAIRYNYYICIDIQLTENTQNKKHAFDIPLNLIKNRIRKLVLALQHSPFISYAHPFPHAIDGLSTGKSNAGKCLLVGFEVTEVMINVYDAISSVLKYFLATELSTNLLSMYNFKVKCICLQWNHLPEQIFEDGKEAAIGERAKYVLRQAHNKHMVNIYG